MSDAPEPDVLEEDQVVDPAQEVRPPKLDPETPEADALEQAIELPDEDEYEE